jgi:hypothetical protein
MGVVADNAHGPKEQKFLRRFFKSGRFPFSYLAWRLCGAGSSP